MGHLKFNKTNKCLYHSFDDKYKKVNLSIIPYLHHTISLNDNTTISDILNILFKNTDDLVLLSDILYDASRGVSITDFMCEFKKIPTDKSDLINLEIYWCVDYSEDGLYTQAEIHGVDSYTQPNSISLCDINNLKHLPLKLNTTFKIIDTTIVDTKDKTIIKNKTLLNTTKEFTLYDVLFAIIYEFTYYGNKSDKLKIINKLNSMVYEYDTK